MRKLSAETVQINIAAAGGQQVNVAEVFQQRVDASRDRR